MDKTILGELTVRYQQDGFQVATVPGFSRERMAALLECIKGRTKPDQVYLDRRRRRVFRCGDVICKYFAFNSLRDILNSRSYGPSEFACHQAFLQAFGQLAGVRVVRALAYFERPLWLLSRWHHCNGMAIEYMADTEEIQPSQLMLAVPLIAHLYRKGIYHPDVTRWNLFHQTTTGELVLIDYMWATIYPQPNWEAMLIMASRLAWSMSDLPEEEGRRFINAVMDALPELKFDRGVVWECFKRLSAFHEGPRRYRRYGELPKDLRAMFPQ